MICACSAFNAFDLWRGSVFAEVAGSAWMGRPPTKLAEALRGLRRRLGLSMSEVSRRTGIAISTLSKVESGKMSLTDDKLSQLCQGLDVDFADFLSGS